MSNSSTAFVLDIEQIRANARKKMAEGALTEAYSLNNSHVVEMLNAALATELICTLRYKQHYFMCEGKNAQVVADEFLEHAQEEQDHADRLAERITQLGGEPDLNPESLLSNGHSRYVAASDIEQMIRENLVAERIAIDSYREMISYLGDNDPTTRRLLEEILASEEEHADDLAGLMSNQ